MSDDHSLLSDLSDILSIHIGGVMTYDNLTGHWNMSTNMSTSQLTSYLREIIVIDVYLVTLLICFGFLGNALTIAVLCRERDKTSATNWLLQTLAVVDTLYLIACIFIQPLKTINEAGWWPRFNSVFPYMDCYVRPWASVAQTITVWAVVALTVDRYVAVCRPYSTHLRTIRRAQIVMAGVFITAVVYNIPIFFEREVVTPNTSGTNESFQGRCVKKTFTHSLLYSVFYKTVCHFVLRSIGPLVLLIVLNVSLVRALRSMDHRRKDLISKSTQHRENITLMLVVVVTVFIVCQLPDVVLRLIATQTHPLPGSRAAFHFRCVNSVTNLMLTLNSSVNFLIYCLVGRKFRRILVQMFSGSCCRIPGHRATSETYERQQMESMPPDLTNHVTRLNATTVSSLNESQTRLESSRIFNGLCHANNREHSVD